MFGMSKELFLQLAFIKAYEVEFGTDEFDVMENLDYSEEKKYCSLQDVIDDENINNRLDEYAEKIRDIICDMD